MVEASGQQGDPTHSPRFAYRREGAGQPLLMLHAEDGAGAWRTFHDVLARRFEVILPEHPGFGAAERPEWLDSMHELVYGYLEFLDGLGVGPMHLAGESFGGWLAAELAAAAPERFRSLTLIGPLGLAWPGTPDIFRMSAAQWRQATLHRPPAEELPLPTRDELVQQARVRATLARLAWNPYLHDPRLPYWLHRAAMPALLVWGQEDRLIPPDAARQWLDRLPAGRLEVVPNAGHFVTQEEPELAAGLIQA